MLATESIALHQQAAITHVFSLAAIYGKVKVVPRSIRWTRDRENFGSLCVTHGGLTKRVNFGQVESMSGQVVFSYTCPTGQVEKKVTVKP